MVDLNARKKAEKQPGSQRVWAQPLSFVIINSGFFASLPAADSKLLPATRKVCSGFTGGWINSTRDWLGSLTAVTKEKCRAGGLQ